MGACPVIPIETINRHVDKWLSTPFAWGKSDCCTSIADLIKDTHGYDPMRYFRGRYRSKSGFVRMLHTDGYATIYEALVDVARDHDWREPTTDDASIGIDQDRTAIYVRHESGFWIARSMTGYSTVRDRSIEAAWCLT